MKRDPRKNPVAGDIVQSGRYTYYVTKVTIGTVYYTDAPPVEVMSCSAEDWVAFAKHDQVIKRGDEATADGKRGEA